MISRLMAVLYMAVLVVIIYLANTGRLAAFVSVSRIIPWGDTLGHFILMGLLSFCVNYLFKVRVLTFGGAKILIGSLWVTVFVIIEECSQLFLVNRNFSLLDLCADFAGIWLFGWLATMVCRVKVGGGQV